MSLGLTGKRRGREVWAPTFCLCLTCLGDAGGQTLTFLIPERTALESTSRGSGLQKPLDVPGGLVVLALVAFLAGLDQSILQLLRDTRFGEVLPGGCLFPLCVAVLEVGEAQAKHTRYERHGAAGPEVLPVVLPLEVNLVLGVGLVVDVHQAGHEQVEKHPLRDFLAAFCRCVCHSAGDLQEHTAQTALVEVLADCLDGLCDLGLPEACLGH